MSAPVAATAARAAALAASLTCSALASTVQEAYLKASDTQGGDQLGWSAAVHGDTAVVGSRRSAYVYVRDDGVWSLQAQLVPSNEGGGDEFGRSVAIWDDTIVVGAPFEDSSATGVNGDGGNDGAPDSGAAYVFVRDGATWTQQAYLKASNTDAGDWFGLRVAMSGDTVVVGAPLEDSSSTDIGGDQLNNDAAQAGAAYVFVRDGSTWSQQAYVKASNTGEGDQFAEGIGIDGDTLVIGASAEDSASTGIDGDELNNDAANAGAAYVFVRTGGSWSQEAYLKASNTESGDNFGYSVSVDGDTLVVGAANESSGATGVNGNQADNSVQYAGAAYVFVLSGGTWGQEAYLKRASSPVVGDSFGFAVAMSDGRVACGAWNYQLATPGVAELFERTGGSWVHAETIEASNAEQGDAFGFSVGLDDRVLVVGAPTESSAATGVNGDENDNSAFWAGAAYAFDAASATIQEFVFVSGMRSVSAVAELFYLAPKCEPTFCVAVLQAAESTDSARPFDAHVLVDEDQYGVNMTSWQVSSITPSSIVASGGVTAVVDGVTVFDLLYANVGSQCSLAIDLTAASVVAMSGTLVVGAATACSDAYVFVDAGAQLLGSGLASPVVASVSGSSTQCVSEVDEPLEFSFVVALPPGSYQFGAGASVSCGTEGGSAGDGQFDVVLSILGDPADFGDLNGDAAIDSADLGLLLAMWGTGDPVADLDDNGVVDGGDLGVILAYWSPG